MKYSIRWKKEDPNKIAKVIYHTFYCFLFLFIFVLIFLIGALYT